MTPPMTTNATNATNASNLQLKLHIINAGIGESIVIHMPNDKWGVVDCYASSVADPSTNPTLQFFLKRQPQVKELEFLCLTHPHDDHYRGMSQLINHFSIKYFWQFAAMTREHLLNLVKHLKGDALKRGDVYDLDSANDLQTTLHLVNRMRKRKSHKLYVKYMCDIKPLYPLPVKLTEKDDPSYVEIISIAPSSNQVAQYQDSLRSCFTENGRLKPDVPRLRHNDVSAALLIRYGRTRVVLGSDVEASNWQDTLSTFDNRELAAHAVKVSHHGSTTGYTPNLWSVFSANGEPSAIITPYRKHRLPKREAVEHIKRHTKFLMTTCRPAVLFDTATNFDIWQEYAPQLQFPIRLRFRSFYVNRSSELGICSLTFNSHGNRTSVEFDGVASPL